MVVLMQDLFSFFGVVFDWSTYTDMTVFGLINWGVSVFLAVYVVTYLLDMFKYFVSVFVRGGSIR